MPTSELSKKGVAYTGLDTPRLVHEKCSDCYNKTHVPKYKDPDLSWLEWKDGAENVTKYQTLDSREKAVFLKVNTHRPERLRTVKEKGVTHLEPYLAHGIIPQVDNMKELEYDPYKPRPAQDEKGRMLPTRGTVAEKILMNDKTQMQFLERRDKQWTQHNWRPKSAWQKLDYDTHMGKTKASFIRDKNNVAIYASPPRKEDARRNPYHSNSPEDKLREWKNVKSYVEKDLMPLIENIDSTSLDVSELKRKQKMLRNKLTRENNRPKKSVRYAEPDAKELEEAPLFTDDEMLRIRMMPLDQKTELINQYIKNRQEERKRMKGQQLRYIKYWDGYGYKFSPTEVEVHSPNELQATDPNDLLEQQELKDYLMGRYEAGHVFEKGPEVIHHSKQNGYRHKWFDAVNATHHPRVQKLNQQLM